MKKDYILTLKIMAALYGARKYFYMYIELLLIYGLFIPACYFFENIMWHDIPKIPIEALIIAGAILPAIGSLIGWHNKNLLPKTRQHHIKEQYSHIYEYQKILDDLTVYEYEMKSLSRDYIQDLWNINEPEDRMQCIIELCETINHVYYYKSGSRGCYFEHNTDLDPLWVHVLYVSFAEKNSMIVEIDRHISYNVRMIDLDIKKRIQHIRADMRNLRKLIL